MPLNLWDQTAKELLDFMKPLVGHEGYFVRVNAEATGFDYAPGTGEQGPANVLTIGTVTSGITPAVEITGESPNQVLNFVLAPGDPGEQGPQGPVGATGSAGIDGTNATNPNFSIGSVTSGPIAAVALSGAYPDLQLAFTLQPGDTGPTGNTGPQGPSNTISIGSVTSDVNPSATLTGVSPNQVLNLVLPRGAAGPAGAVNSLANIGAGLGLVIDVDINGIGRFKTLIGAGDVVLTDDVANNTVILETKKPGVGTMATNYTIANTDSGVYTRLTNATAINITVPVDLATDDAAAEFYFRRAGAGTVTFVADSGVTINPPIGGSLDMGAIGDRLTLKKVAANEYDLY